MKKLKIFNSIYFRCKSHFEKDDTQNYLLFQPLQRYFKRIAGIRNDNHVYYWKSKGLSDERINSIKTSDYGITPSSVIMILIRVKFDGDCLKQDSGSLFHGGIENVYIVYEISKNINISDYPTLENCLFWAVKLTKNADIDNMDILVIELELIDKEIFHFLALD